MLTSINTRKYTFQNDESKQTHLKKEINHPTFN